MCGIIGSYNMSKHPTFVKDNIVHLTNRGPDSKGIVSMGDTEFGHTRLSIQDTSENGIQPMLIDDCMITYNGELWNVEEIKNKILEKNPDVVFNSSSDTELILRYYICFCRDDPTELLRGLNGMIAAAIYDLDLDRTILFRDAVGEKPLYYTQDGRFASKQSILSDTKLYKESAITDYMVFGYPRDAMFDGVYELKPGHMLFNDGRIVQVTSVFDDEIPNNYAGTYEEFKEEFFESVRLKFTNTDVPLALCLSGGLDSSLILAVYNKIFGNCDNLKTFTVNIGESTEIDANNALYLSKVYNTDHSEISVKNERILDIEEHIDKVDTPIELGSTIITSIIAEHIKKNHPECKIVILGDGADEIFMGYKRHLQAFETLYDGKEFNYVQRISKNNIKGFDITCSPWVTNLDDVRRFDMKNELVHYHMKRVDMIFSEYGIEARCPFLYEDIMKIVDKSDSTNNFEWTNNQYMNKIWIRKFLKELSVPEKIVDQEKRPLKLYKDMDMFRSNIFDYFTNTIKRNELAKGER